MSELLITGCDALTAPGRLLTGVDISIDGGRIMAIGPSGDQAAVADVVIDGSGMLAMPGLVNAHTHSPENCLRGAGERLPLEPWLCLMVGIGGHYDAEAHRVTALAGAIEMLRTGTTSVLDHLWMTPPSPEAIDAVMSAYRDIGIRASVAPLMDDADSTSALAARHGIDFSKASNSNQASMLPTAELLAVLEDAMRRWHGSEGGRLQVFAGPGGIQWCSDKLLDGLADAARRHGGGFHVHLLETTVQDETCRLRFGTSGLVALDERGILAANVSLPHSVWIDEGDVQRIAARGAVVVHNPAANLRLGSGTAPVPALLAAGAEVALGADGSASSDNQNVWQEIKLAAMIHNNGDADVWVDGHAALIMATAGGAAALCHRDGLGTLAPGAPADIVLLDRASDGLAGAVALESALALSEDGRSVRHVFVAGRHVVENGRITTIDEQAVLSRLAELAAERVPRLVHPASEVAEALGQASALRSALNDRTRSMTREVMRRSARSLRDRGGMLTIESIRLAVVQPLCHQAPDGKLNLQDAVGHVRDAAACGAQIVLFPEGYPGPLRIEDEFDATAALASAAVETSTAVCWSRIEQGDDGLYRKVAYIHGSDGEALRYVRGHPATGDVHPVLSGTYLAPGDGFGICEVAGVRVGVLICSELWIPEIARTLVLRGAEILLAPAGGGFGAVAENWQLVTRVRAIENQCFVGMTQNLFGDEDGAALVAGPEDVLAASTREPVVSAELDLARMRWLRARDDGMERPKPFTALPGLLRARRPELYGELVAQRDGLFDYAAAGLRGVVR